MAITPLTKLTNGQPATETTFNTPLIDADNNFEELDDLISAHYVQISGLSTDVGTLETTVGTLQTDIGLVEGRVSAIEEDVTTIQEDISALDERVTDLEEGGGGGGGTAHVINTIRYEWVSNGEISIFAGGVISDGTITYEIESDTSVTFADLDTGSEEASKLYYIWIGLVTDVQTVKLSLSATTPTGLTDPLKLRGAIRNNASSNIVFFLMSDSVMHYGVDVNFNANDETGKSLSVSTSFVDIDISAFVPQGTRLTVYAFSNGGNLYYDRLKGSSASSGVSLFAMTIRQIMVDSSGVFQAKCNTNVTHYFCVLSYDL